MRLHVKYFALGLGVFLLIAGVSYGQFYKYQPKVLRRVAEVRGIQSDEEKEEFTYPQNAKNVSFNQSYKSRQTTFQIEKPPKDVQNFYKSIFMEKGWTIESEGATNDFFVTKYKKGLSTAMVMSSYQGLDHITIASVEIKTE